MRRVDNSSSQDGVETTSLTSSVENEVRKPAATSKTKRSSIKRKMPNFNDDSDDTVNEPLLQSENDISEFNQSAKYVSSKPKTDLTNKRSDDTNIGIKVQKTSSTTCSQNITSKIVTTDIASASTSVTASIHNYMNTNIFGVIDTAASKTIKSTLIVEIDNSKSSTYNPSPLIFTTAKIHTDNKAKEMEPLHVTPVPILSTIEGNVIKSIPSTFDNSEKHYDSVKYKSDSQKKCSNENEQSMNKNASNVKEHSATISSNIKLTSVSTNVPKPVPEQSTIKTSLDKPLVAQIDSKIPIVNVKVETMNSTGNKILHDEKSRSTVDKTKKNVLEKSLADPSKFEIQQKPVKTNNEKQSVLKDDSQKQTSNGITAQKPCLITNKVSNLTSSDSGNTSNMEKASNSVSSFPTNKQLQRQKKTVEDIVISDSKNQTIACDPKVNISKEDSAILLDNKTKGGIIKPTTSKTSLESQNVVTMLPSKSSSTSNYSSVSDKPSFVSAVPKGTVNTANKTDPSTSALSGKGKNVDKTGSSISEQSENKNISDNSGPSISIPKEKISSSDKPVSSTSITSVKNNSTEKSKTSPLIFVAPGKDNNIEKPGSSNSAATQKTSTANKHVSASSVPVVKTNTNDKSSSLTSVPLSKANISNKPDSLSSAPLVSSNTIKSGSEASTKSVKTNSTEKTSLPSTSKATTNIPAKPSSVLSEKVNTAVKPSSLKTAPAEQTNIVVPSVKPSATVMNSGRKDNVITNSGSNISKSVNIGRSSGKESVAEIKKASEKTKPKISPTLKSEASVVLSDRKSPKGVTSSTPTNGASNVFTTTGNKKIGSDTRATSSSSVTSSIKGSKVSSLPSSSTSAIGTSKNTEPMFSENKKDSRA